MVRVPMVLVLYGPGPLWYESQLRISHFRRVAAGRLLFCWVA